MSASVTQDNTQIAHQFDYKILGSSYPIYRYSKILPLSGLQSVGLTTSGTQDVMMEIPTKVHNPSEFILSWTRRIAPQAGYAWVFADTPGEIQELQLYTRGGKYICNINNFQNYMKSVRKVGVPSVNMITRDSKSLLYPCNQVPAAGQRNDGTANNLAILEPKYFNVSANATEYVEYVQFKLGDVIDSFFSVDKDVVFPEILVMRIVWSGSKLGFNSSLNNTPVGGVQTALVAGAITGMGATYSSAVTDLCLYMAVENNHEVAAAIISKANAGMKMLIPVIYSFKNNLQAASTHTVSIRFNRAHGLYLKRIYHTIFNSVEGGNVTPNLYYDHNNLGANATVAGKITSYYTMLDNERRQEIALRCTLDKSEDWLHQRRVLSKSILSNNNIYEHNWLHIEAFDDCANALQRELNPLDDNTVSGLPLDTERKWDFYGDNMAQTPAGSGNYSTYNHYTYAIVLRELHIAPSNIDVL